MVHQYSHIFGDIIREDSDYKKTKMTMNYLLTPALLFGNKVLAALMFGVFDHETINSWQIWLLVLNHSWFFLHLVKYRPYINLSLLIAEILCSICEIGILIAAIALRHNIDQSTVPTFMVLCAQIDAWTLSMYEILRFLKMVLKLVRKKIGRFRNEQMPSLGKK